MKKLALFLTIILSVLSLGLFTACESSQKTIVIAAPDGAPALAMYSMMKECNTLNDYKIEYKIVGGAQDITTMVTKGEADVGIMPTNIAAKLYNGGVDIKLLSVNVFGVLYMIGTNPIESLTDLYGKVVVNIGKGGTPDLALKYILDSKNIEYVESDVAVNGKIALTYVSEASEVGAKIKLGKAEYGILGEPAATKISGNIGASIVLDIQKEFNQIAGSNALTQAGAVVGKRVYKDPELLFEIFDRLEKNKDYIFENASSVKDTLQKYGSGLEVDFNANILNRCNLGCVKSGEAREQLEAYFNSVIGYDKSFIGGKLPDDEFYIN